MPKLKTHKAASKRILKRTQSGVFMARAMSAQHLTGGKAARVSQNARHVRALSRANKKNLTKLLPYLR
ncbi:50S ribosomal protein L35 [Candidatus Berkelbacteria bacterium]|nr:50S ribosomal protein L35 [Candidatus Berkelbacteria bacterium]